jgi:hypothetical protein
MFMFISHICVIETFFTLHASFFDDFQFPYIDSSFLIFVHFKVKNSKFYTYMRATVRYLENTQVAPLQPAYIGFCAKKLQCNISLYGAHFY